MSDTCNNMVTVGHDSAEIQYFGRWHHRVEGGVGCRSSNTQYNACEFSFKGPTVRWIGTKGQDHGRADVYIDGRYHQTVDSYSAKPVTGVVNFEHTGLGPGRVHTLRIVVKKDRNPRATGCYQAVSGFQCVTPVDYPAQLKSRMGAEYAVIRAGEKAYLGSESWVPVAYGASAPPTGVRLAASLFSDAVERNAAYLNFCFSQPFYCTDGFQAFKPDSGPGWSQWLPASNEGRMLAGAANTLRWGERPDMRRIVDTIVTNIRERMRQDGYYNYYPEEQSYALTSGINSERKNYDRVFWTRGLLAAGMAGNSEAYSILRKMYDWFNSSPYLPYMLEGYNSTNGLPGGPLVYLSPVGVVDDLVVTARYYDQEYWIDELKNGEPLCVVYYPGERPHCYDLLGLEAFVDEYRATGAQKYLDAAIGGWEIYRNNYKHVGGATAICEIDGPYPPRSYYLTVGHNGETCGSVFWVNINSKLLQLFPTEEKYAAEIEEAIYNVVFAAQDRNGYIRYHNRMQGTKEDAACSNTCCEVSSVGLIARLPEFVYSIADDGPYVNLYTPSTMRWSQKGQQVVLDCETGFPYDPRVTITVRTTEDVAMNTRLRVPCWSKNDLAIQLNGSYHVTGPAGSYVSLDRIWSDGDTLSFELPVGFRAVKYTGLEQIGEFDRYALMYGPVLLALSGELAGPGGVPQIDAVPERLPELLIPVEGEPLSFDLMGHPGYRFMPYWQITTESFTCFPIVQPNQRR